MGRKTNARVGAETSQAPEMDDAAALDVGGAALGEAADDGEAAGAIAQPPQPAEGGLQDGEVSPGGDPGGDTVAAAAEKEGVTDEAAHGADDENPAASGQRDPDGTAEPASGASGGGTDGATAADADGDKLIFDTTPATADDAIARLVRDGDADPEGTARLNYPGLFAEWPPYDPDAERCVACNVAFRAGEMVLPNADGGIIHIACCGPERESYVNGDGEPLADDEPIPTGYAWHPEAPPMPPAEPAAAPEEKPMSAFETAACAARWASYEVLEVIADIEVSEQCQNKPKSLEAARFILAERGAPAESIPIHLALKGLGGARKPDALTVLGWAVFKDVFCRVFDHLDAIEKAAAAAAAVAPPAPAWPGERVMKAEPGPLDAAGGMLRR